MVGFVSTVYITSGCDGQGNCEGETNGAVTFTLMLSYYWTSSVIRNVVHVTVAGTVVSGKQDGVPRQKASDSASDQVRRLRF